MIAEAEPPAEEKKKEKWVLAFEWWASMQDTNAKGEPNPERDRGALARLRRGDFATGVTEPAALALYRKIGDAAFDRERLRETLRLALVLPHVRRHTGTTIARALGPQGPDGENAVLSRLRLQNLLRARSEEDIVRGFRRAVALLGGEANVFDLAKTLIRWEDERTRIRFAFEYFNAAQATPPEPSEPATHI